MRLPHIVFLVLDAVRYDRLAMNGYARTTMPGLEKLSLNGQYFSQAFSTAPWTIPSQASMFTGRYPSEHGATQATLRLGKDLPVLAEALRDRVGYRTCMFATNSWFDPQTGLTRGFERVYGGPVRKTRKIRWRVFKLRKRIRSWLPPGRNMSLTRRQVADMIRALEEAHTGTKPHFLFANFMDAHLPLRPSPQALQQFLEAERWTRAKEIGIPAIERAYVLGQRELSAGDLQVLSDLYDAALFDLDLALGDLFAALCSPQLSGRVLLVITADHGENLGEHNLMGHQFCLYDTLIHVPLILYWPGVIPAGSSDRLVQLTDLYHTILSVVGVDNTGLGVRSEFDLLRDDGEYPEREEIMAEYARPVMSIQTLLRYTKDASSVSHLDRELVALRTKRYKYIYVEVVGNPSELYDVSTDPRETHNLVIDHPEIAARMRNRLLEWRSQLACGQADQVEAGQGVLDDMDEVVTKRLEDLGYL